MEGRDSFSGYHPAVNLLYYCLVLGITMFHLHPAFLAVSLVGAASYCVRLRGKKTLRGMLLGVVPMMLLAAVVNPAFNHQGVTILMYLPSGNPLTLESILYGLTAAEMLAAVILWFVTFQEVMSSDKFVYLFGRAAPALSLLLSMTLRFVPKLRDQGKRVILAQRCAGRDLSQGSLIQRARLAVTVFSILVTWSLENAIETADSMKSRGYGLPGRTAFSIYRLDSRDRSMLGWLVFCGVYLLSGWAVGGMDFRFYPTLRGMQWSPWTVSFLLVYLALCLTPCILDRRERALWQRSSSGT